MSSYVSSFVYFYAYSMFVKLPFQAPVVEDSDKSVLLKKKKDKSDLSRDEKVYTSKRIL